MSQTVNRFRQRRARLLRAMIETMHQSLGRDIHILDVGGRSKYWENVGLKGVSRITILNNEPTELHKYAHSATFEPVVGDACDLANFGDKSIDLVHSNSVIEHVGSWNNMQRMALELLRVGRRGWVQTPAWEFPVEPHHRLPFVHWLSAPAQRALLRVSPRYPGASLDERRRHVERINLVSKAEFQTLFPSLEVITERVAGWPKSFVALW